jgi:hypothetical protein
MVMIHVQSVECATVPLAEVGTGTCFWGLRTIMDYSEAIPKPDP